VREVEDARPIGDAVLQPPDPVDMLLIVGAGGDDELRLPVQDPPRSPPETVRTTGASRSVMVGLHLEQVADLVVESRAGARRPSP
jgi:hypothetical protein